MLAATQNKTKTLLTYKPSRTDNIFNAAQARLQLRGVRGRAYVSSGA